MTSQEHTHAVVTGLCTVARRAAAIELAKRLPWSPDDVNQVLEYGDSLHLPFVASIEALDSAAQPNVPPEELMYRLHKAQSPPPDPKDLRSDPHFSFVQLAYALRLDRLADWMGRQIRRMM